MTKAIDMTGKIFGRLTVLRFHGTAKDRQATWVCKCMCGTESIVAGGHLRSGHSKSCGCLSKELLKTGSITHGMSYTSTFGSWKSMLIRCGNPNNPAYKNYGGRGITVCDRWKSFENFIFDMGEKPNGTTIDRIDNDRGYEPGNCRWATVYQQSRNRRSNIWITVDGRSMVAKDWARELGTSQQVITNRIAKGWDAKSACSIKVLGPGQHMRAMREKWSKK